jgi:LL-diaminopimelate aminotransferase
MPPENERFSNLLYLPCTVENAFVPALPQERPDLIYLCYPNNPTGTVLTKDQLAEWVAYAREHECVIFFDAAYEAFVNTPGIPHSIYEIEGAREVAVEFRSYSKGAGFTGLRCGFVVVPKTVHGWMSANGSKTGTVALHGLWNRRQTTKYNGCPYIVQRAAEATHSPEGKRETKAILSEYMANAQLIRSCFERLGLRVAGGIDAPYVWVQLPKGMDSWTFFDLLLHRSAVVGTPGSGFGPSGRGYFRLTGFGSRESSREAVERLRQLQL